MPREQQKRGRREQQKRKKQQHDDDEQPYTKRPKKEHIEHTQHLEQPTHLEHSADWEHSTYPDQTVDATPSVSRAFYGLLDEDEHEYFRRADELLEHNQFDDAQARTLFLDSVWKEANGKELRIASSQSCSRLLERLLLLSTPIQLKSLFQAFSGHFLDLVQHRFASHCCEALFRHAAPIVTQELGESDIAPPLPPPSPPSSDADYVAISMEQHFLRTLNELQPHLGFLVTETFASHTLRMLLLIFSGASLEAQDRPVVQSKRKEKISISGFEKTAQCAPEKRTMPESFSHALEKVIESSTSAFEPHFLRLLSTHPQGSPTLQLLLKLELSHFGKSRAKNENPIIYKLLPDDPIAEGTESASFIHELVYHAIGSRLLETIVENAPGKLFKSIYADFFATRMGSLARNEIASYVAAKILERLGKDDLKDAMCQIAHQIPNLVERGRTAIIRTLIERCVVREVDMSSITAQLDIAYAGTSGFEIANLLKLDQDENKTSGKDGHSSEKVHGSLLAQTMMSVPGSLGNLIFDSLIKLPSKLSNQLACDPTASRTLQAALKSPNASIVFRRKMIQRFYGSAGEFALDPVASRVVDAIWQGTQGLAYIRERMAEELAENEKSLRECHCGRAVWRNWNMDLYKRRRPDWIKYSRSTAGNGGFQSFPDGHNDTTAHPNHTSRRAGKHMTAIELARQRHATNKAARTKRGENSEREKKKGKKKEAEAEAEDKPEKISL